VRGTNEAVRPPRESVLLKSARNKIARVEALKDALDTLEYRDKTPAHLTNDHHQSEGDSSCNKSILNGGNAVVVFDKAKELAHRYS
jgi:hypothetical protein